MIAKPFAKSHHADALIALHKRLSKSHPKYSYIRDEMMQKIAGDIGEEAVMRELEKLKFPHKFYVFHNISLYSETNFQMDILLISPYYALILEVKNISGEIEILTNPSILLRTKPTGEINTYKSPIPQLEEYTYQLSQLFKKLKVNIPVYGAIVFAFASSYVKSTPTETVFLLANEVRKFIREIKAYQPIIKEEDLGKLKSWIINKNKEYKTFPLTKHYSIDPKEITTGVECLNCGFIGMKKIMRNWVCPCCRNLSKLAHESTLKDYFLVYKETINNEECRRFFHLKNKHEATRILKGANLVVSGKAKKTHYMTNL